MLTVRDSQPVTLLHAVSQVLQAESARLSRGEITLQTLAMLTSRLRIYVLPHFTPNTDLTQIRHPELLSFVEWLGERGLQAASIRHVLASLRKVLSWALVHGHIGGLPAFPKIKTQSTPRGGFTAKEYLKLWQTARVLAQEPAPDREPTHRDRLGGLFARGQPTPPEFAWLIAFMVNSFIRPSDLRFIQHQHVQIIRGKHTYLRLSLPETKKHSVQIVTLRPAVRVYEALLKHAQAGGCGRPEDFLFVPQVTNRKTAMVLMDLHFRRILERSRLREGKRGQKRTLYSLRHTAITFRLLYGSGIDLLTLARNARTSVEMIERFYASELSAEMNIAMLQSRR